MMSLAREGAAARDLPPVRCVKCNRLLFLGFAERVEIKCPKCGRLQSVHNTGEDNENKEVNK